MKPVIICVLLALWALKPNAQIAGSKEEISPLKVGDYLPEAVLVDLNNEKVSLHSVLQQKPAVVVFYRGGWCPYCNTQLASLAEAESAILESGYQIIAISPDDNRNLRPTMEKDSIHYQIFSDPGGELIQKAGIAYRINDFSQLTISVRTRGETTEILPVPTVMIVDTQGKILFEYLNMDIKKRLSTETLVDVLNSLSLQ